MKTLIAKADVLIEAMAYIRAFRGETVVVKFGGSAMENPEVCNQILTDIAFLECVGVKPVIVHGGGKAISQRMTEKGLKPVFVKGLRVTDAESIRIVEEVLTDVINAGIVKTLKACGAQAVSLPGSKVLRVKKRLMTDAQTGPALDLGFVGEVTAVDPRPIRNCLAASRIPVITPLGLDAQGKLYNINADDAAAAVAMSLQARKLVFLSDVPGLLKDPRRPESLIATVRANAVDALVRDGTIAGGMVPKILSAVTALAAGVKKVHLIDGRLPHSLLLEIFTDQGIGTEIIHHE